MEFNKDLKNKKITVKKEFNGPLDEVWNAWTSSEILDKWWAPKPWVAKTKEMDFRVGGSWFYAMVGPNGEETLGRTSYEKITPLKNFSGTDSFCNADGSINSEMPTMHWNCTFEKSEEGTMVTVEITFKSEADLNKILELGFKEGFGMALTNLDEIFDSNWGHLR